jgi:hypothetical protein
MAAAWEYGQLAGRAGDDLEFWFRNAVDRCFVDGKLVGLDPVIVACAEFVVEQVMAVANEPYAANATPKWTLQDLGTLCTRLAQARGMQGSGSGEDPAEG